MKYFYIYLTCIILAFSSCKKCYDCSVKSTVNTITSGGMVTNQEVVEGISSELCDDDMIEFEKEVNSRRRDTTKTADGLIETIYTSNCAEL